MYSSYLIGVQREVVATVFITSQSCIRVFNSEIRNGLANVLDDRVDEMSQVFFMFIGLLFVLLVTFNILHRKVELAYQMRQAI